MKATKAVVPGLLVMALGSLAANVALVRAAHVYYSGTSAVRLDPAGLKMYEAVRAIDGTTAGAAGPPVLVFYGDSRAYMWPAPPSVPYRVVNRGVSYQTTEQILLRFDADIAPLRPAVVVIEAGVNDLKTIADFPERRSEIMADCERDLARIVELSRQTGAQVVLVTVFDIGDIPIWRKPFWSDDVEVAVREVNAFLPGLVRDKVVLFDAGAVLRDESGRITRPFQLDHLHLTPAAYGALDEKLVPLLATLPALTPSAGAGL